MSADIKYSPIPLLSDLDDAPQLKKSKFFFPKVSRFKLISVSVVVTLSVVLITLSCFQSGYFSRSSVCNLNKDQPNVASSTNKDSRNFSHMKRRLPQCIIIGARKAGTRALISYLNIHPDVVTTGDEMHFFDDDFFYNQSQEAYRKKLPPSFEDQLTVEKTPAYFTTPNVPERIYRMNRTIKLLLILRDPIERALSDYLQIAENKGSRNKPMPPFEHLCLDSSGRINKSYKALSRSVYHRHLARWLELFSLDQIYIIDSEDLVHNPAVVMQGVEYFLGLEHKIKDSHFYFNKTKGFYCIKTDLRPTCLTETKGRVHPEIDDGVLHKLRRYFAPHNLKLYKMIGRTFNWVEE